MLFAPGHAPFMSRETQVDTAAERQERSRRARRLGVWPMIGAMVLAIFVAWTSPTTGTFLFLGGALLVIGLLLGLRRPARKVAWLSVRVHPGLVVAMTTLFLGLVLSELILRIFLFQRFPDFEKMTPVKLGYQYDSTLGWFPAPNSHETFGHIHQAISLVHNSQGFRDPEPALDSRPGVLFLGDSFTWGYGVDAAERFTDRLRSRHPEWRVFNFGVVGYGTDQEYLLLQKHFEQYKPRLVFLVFCAENDHIDNCSNGDSVWAFKPYFRAGPKGLKLCGVPVPCSDWVFCLHHPLLSKPYLFRMAMRAWGNLRSPRPGSGPDPTTAILEALQKYVSSQGASFCVGITGRDPNIEQFLLRSKIPWLDLSTDLRLEGDWHWSAKGNAYVADKIEQFLVARKLF